MLLPFLKILPSSTIPFKYVKIYFMAFTWGNCSLVKNQLTIEMEELMFGIVFIK
jgi:hypothetical protein